LEEHITANFWVTLEANLTLPPAAGFFLGLFFYPEDGCNMFLQNVG
jgi:hypothetical protein